MPPFTVFKTPDYIPRSIVINKRKTITLVIGRWLCVFHAISPRNERPQGRYTHTHTHKTKLLLSASRFFRVSKTRHNGYRLAAPRDNNNSTLSAVPFTPNSAKAGLHGNVRSVYELVMHAADDDNAIAVATNERPDAICIGSVAWPICAAHISIQLVVRIRLFFFSFFFSFSLS